MANLKKSLQREALQLVFWQFIVTMVLSLIVLLMEGLTKGISTLLGGSAYIIPQFFFAWQVFSFAQPRLSGQFMVAFFLGEFAKLVISAILFILFVKYLSVHLTFLMAGFIVAIVSFWFVCSWYFGRSNVSNPRISS